MQTREPRYEFIIKLTRSDIDRDMSALMWAANEAGQQLTAAYRAGDFETEKKMHDLIGRIASMQNQLVLFERQLERGEVKEEVRDGGTSRT